MLPTGATVTATIYILTLKLFHLPYLVHCFPPRPTSKGLRLAARRPLHRAPPLGAPGRPPLWRLPRDVYQRRRHSTEPQGLVRRLTWWAAGCGRAGPALINLTTNNLGRARKPLGGLVRAAPRLRRTRLWALAARPRVHSAPSIGGAPATPYAAIGARRHVAAASRRHPSAEISPLWPLKGAPLSPSKAKRPMMALLRTTLGDKRAAHGASQHFGSMPPMYILSSSRNELRAYWPEQPRPAALPSWLAVWARQN